MSMPLYLHACVFDACYMCTMRIQFVGLQIYVANACSKLMH